MSDSPKFEAFPLYTVPGDVRHVDIGNVRITATVHFDPDAKPTDYDCYSRGQVEAWERDEWRYVGVVLSVSVGDTEIEPHAVSLWGIECNFPGSDKNAHLTACANDLLDEALTEAREKVEQLLKALQAAREGLSNEQTKS